MAFEAIHRTAPDLFGNAWLNSEPIILHEIENKTVLLHFFDSASLRSVESLSYAKAWAQHYAECGLIVIGVHVPTFTFGTNRAVVENTLSRYALWYPVVMDNSAHIALAYDIRRIPAFCLVDKEKNARYLLTDDGNFLEFERALRQLVSECGYRNELPEIICPLHSQQTEFTVRVPQTTDIFLGYLRGTIGNAEGTVPEAVLEYHDPGFYLPDRCYLHGKWFNGREALQYAGTAQESGYILFPYEGRDVYALLSSRDGLPCEITVEQDGVSLSSVFAGNDVVQTRNQKSLVLVSAPRLYHLASNPEVGTHSLRLFPVDSRVEFYALSCSSMRIPDVVPLN